MNTGLLRLQLGRWTLFEPVPQVSERIAGFARFLGALDADVLAMQEVFVRGARRRLVEELCAAFPHAAFADSPSWVGNGLLTLSRHPIEDSAFQRFDHDFLLVRPFATFGLLRTRIRLPGDRPLELFNTHLTAGPFGDPERARVERMRDRQIRQLLEAAGPRAPRVVLTGDFNAGPEASIDNYRRFAAAGFVDAFDRAEHHGSPLRTTWTPENSLTQSGPHSSSPPQRIDHVFVHATAAPAVSRVTITEAVDPAGAPLSDHRLVLAEFRLTGDRDGSTEGAPAG
nr:endonuclease/exonuclease/phosphatase family protein [Wenzhouxiangella sp. XN79A]